MVKGILNQDPRSMTRESRMAYLDALARDQGIEHEKSNRTRINDDKKRCPMCKGDAGKHSGKGTCYIASCDRGPNNKPCGCHYKLSGMGHIGQEGYIDKKPEIDPLWTAYRAKQTITCNVKQIC